MSFKSNLSIKSLWMFKMARELKRLLLVVARNQVLRRRAVENDLSGVQDVAGFTKKSLIASIMLGINSRSSLDHSFSS